MKKLLLAILLTSINAIAQQGRVKVQEDDVVLHRVPLHINYLSDSTVSVTTSPDRICTYNYKTGALLQKITISEDIRISCITIAANHNKKGYTPISTKEAKLYGLPTTELVRLQTNDNKTELYFDVYAKYDSITINAAGKRDSILDVKRFQFVSELLDGSIKNVSLLSNNDNNYPTARNGAIWVNKELYLQNLSTDKKHTVVVYSQSNTPNIMYATRHLIPYNSLHAELSAAHIMQMVSISQHEGNLIVCDGFAFYNSNGQLLYSYNKSSVDEQIYSFGITNNKLSFSTRRKENNKIVSYVHQYDLAKKTLSLLNSSTGPVAIAIGNDRYTKLYQEEDNYYFYTQQL
jgi:hypothetical protein